MSTTPQHVYEGPIYDLVWRLPKWAYSIRGFGYGNGPAQGYDASELAEALHGGLMAAALYIAIHGGV